MLLNKSGQLAGIGELGELYVRSPHLAAGYIGDEKLTARDVCNQSVYQRLKVTGCTKPANWEDICPMEMLNGPGRNDRRVNIRGFRVELDEVESVLNQHPSGQRRRRYCTKNSTSRRTL